MTDQADPPVKVGRPARINREMIACAAHEIGLDGLTLRAVADHLDVSIAALYHYVSGKEDLMRAAAEYSAATVELPSDSGQHWAVWLMEWAHYNYDVFSTSPGLLAEFLDGAIGAATVAPTLDSILGGLVRQGFDVQDANVTYELIAASTLGTVISEARAQQLSAIRDLPLEDLPHVRKLMRETQRRARPPFEDRVAIVIRGIAAARNEPWGPIEAELRAAADARPA
ncbi:MAG: helix-turn-helix domain-containing protein [Aquihabitans sp.]